MALEIRIVNDVSIPYWKQEGTIRFGTIDPFEFGSLFRRDLGIKSVFEYTSEEEDREDYDEYYSRKLALVEKRYPLMARINDYYEDALFTKEEINALIREILMLKTVATQEKSIRLLDQLLTASKMALQNNAGIILFAD